MTEKGAEEQVLAMERLPHHWVAFPTHQVSIGS